VISACLSTKSRLNFIRNLTEVARTRLSDEEFGRSFYRSISKDIEEADLLLDSFVQFLSINTPLKRKRTVHRLIEEVLKKYQVQLNEKRVTVSKNYDRDLPETIVPDRLLSYILDSVLRYGINSVAPEGHIKFLTKSFKFKKDTTARKRLLREDKQYAKIELLFKTSQSQSESSQESLSLMLLGLTREVVRKNQGMMKIERDERKGIQSISLWFPCERREIPHYRKIDLLT